MNYGITYNPTGCTSSSFSVTQSQYYKDGVVVGSLPPEILVTISSTYLDIVISGSQPNLNSLFNQVKGSYAVKL